MLEDKTKKEGMENKEEKEEMEKDVGSPANEEYFSEIRRSENSSELSDEKMTEEDLANVGGTPKTEEFHSELNRSDRDQGEMNVTDYFDTDYDEDET